MKIKTRFAREALTAVRMSSCHGETAPSGWRVWGTVTAQAQVRNVGGAAWKAVLYGLQGEVSMDVCCLKFSQGLQHVCLLPEQLYHPLLTLLPILTIQLQLFIDSLSPRSLLAIRSTQGLQHPPEHVFLTCFISLSDGAAQTCGCS